ncbi:MAG: GNAT family N-acetyltransferase [Chloroflexi bacterium]|nr:GNAT family N-acetyltransferase [Chloroflexota bacterium]
MVKEAKIERLRWTKRAELLDLLTKSFTGHPLIPTLGAKPKASRAVMAAFVDFFGRMKGSLVYGIRKDGKLVCACLAIDSSSEPSALPLMRFVFSLAVALGWEAGREMESALKEMPEKPGRFLEVILIGTLPEYRQQGLAEQMLHFLRDEAIKQGFDGILAITDRDSPLCNIYGHEGFACEKEITVGKTAQCWMRLEFGKEGPHGEHT